MQQIQMVDAVCFITVTWINKNGHPEPGRVVVALRKMRENILANPALVKWYQSDRELGSTTQLKIHP